MRLLAAVLMAALCQTAFAGELIPVPEPALERMDELVQRQLREKRSRIEILDAKADRAELLAAYVGLGRLTLTYDLRELATACWHNAGVLEPENFRWPYLEGFVAQLEGRYDDAVASFEHAASLAERAGEPYAPIDLRRAQAELERGRPEAARPLFERAADVPALAAAAEYGLGQIAAAEEDFASAARHFEAAVTAQPEASSVHHPLGIAYRQLGEIDKAREHLRRAGRGEVQFADPVATAPTPDATGAGYHHTLGTEAAQTGDRRRAITEFRKALEIDPGLTGTRLSLARVLGASGDAPAALAEYDEALRRDGGSALAHYELGRFLIGLGRRPEAERHFRAALASAPEYRPAFLGLALALGQSGRPAEAAGVLAELVELYPDDREARRRLAGALARSGRGEPALVELDRLLDLDPDDRGARYQRAIVLTELGRHRPAVTELERLLVEPAASSDVLEALATVLAREGDRDFALERLGVLKERLDEGELRVRVEELIAGIGSSDG